MVPRVGEGEQTYLCSLLERLLIYCNQQDGVWSKAIFRLGLYIIDQVLAGEEINITVSTKLLS